MEASNLLKFNMKNGAGGRNRTDMPLRTGDFESENGTFNKPLILGLIPLFV